MMIFAYVLLGLTALFIIAGVHFDRSKARDSSAMPLDGAFHVVACFAAAAIVFTFACIIFACHFIF